MVGWVVVKDSLRLISVYVDITQPFELRNVVVLVVVFESSLSNSTNALVILASFSR